jgi:hypothetical protein
MPPLPVRVSSPAPATKISSLLLPVSVLAFLIVGAVYADSNGNSSGKSYVIFGKANSSAINRILTL